VLSDQSKELTDMQERISRTSDERGPQGPALPSHTEPETIVAKSSKDKKEKKKKNAQLVLRLDKDLRDRFIEACQDVDTSAAREVRRFIRKFLKSYDRGEMDD
jgi:hypothetical protein